MSKEQKKQWLIRILIGGVLGGLLTPAVSLWLNSLRVYEAQTVIEWLITPAMLEVVHSVWAALAVECLLGSVFGAVVMISTLPFADDGKELIVRSVAHFAATAASFSVLLWGCRWVKEPGLIFVWVCVLAVLYLLIWLGRWVGWYQEVAQIRALLGLAPGPSPLKWKETLPYLPFVVLVCCILPAVLLWVDLTFVVDFPLFSGLLYPFLGLPIVGFCSGMSLGKRWGMCWLYPVACFLFHLPMVFLLANSSAMFHCYMISVPALVGMILGWIIRQKVPNTGV